MKKLNTYLLPVLLLVAIVATVLVFSPQLRAETAADVVCEQVDKIRGANCGGDSNAIFSGMLKTVVSTVIFILGGASVLMIVIGGLMYVLSGGDGQNTAKAKDTILYALIGLVVALLAQVIVTFVIGKV